MIISIFILLKKYIFVIFFKFTHDYSFKTVTLIKIKK